MSLIAGIVKQPRTVAVGIVFAVLAGIMAFAARAGAICTGSRFGGDSGKHLLGRLYAAGN